MAHSARMASEAARALGERIKAARAPHDQEWLAGQLEVSQTTVSKWERGEHPPLKRLPAIERVLALPAGTLTAIYHGAEPVEDERGADDALARIAEIRRSLDELEWMIRRRR